MRLKFALLVVGLLCFSVLPVMAQQPITKTFTTDDKTFSFDYPSTWNMEIVNPDHEPKSLLIIRNYVDNGSLETAKDVSIQALLPIQSFQAGAGAAKTPKDIVAQSVTIASPVSLAFGTAAVGSTPQPLVFATTVPSVTEFTVNGRPAAFAYITQQAMGIVASSMFIVVDLGNGYLFSISAGSDNGSLKAVQQNESVILAIVKTMRFTPPTTVYSGNPDLPQVYSGLVGIWERGSITFDYPTNWYVSTPTGGVITMSNKPGNVLNTLPQSGQFIASVQGSAETRASADPNEVFNQCDIANSDLTAKSLVEKILATFTSAQIRLYAQ